MENIAEKENKLGNRIYELDVLRGIGILGVLLNHLAYYVYLVSYQNLKYLNFPDGSEIGEKVFKLCQIFLYSHKLEPIQNLIRCMFVLIVGVCFTLSRNNLVRGVRLFLCAIFMSLCGVVMYLIIGDKHCFITYGIIHALSISILLSYPLYKRIENKYFYLLASVIVFSIGYYNYRCSVWVDYGSLPLYKIVFGEFIGYLRGNGSDSFPGLLVWSLVLFGIFVGKQSYSKKKSLLGLNYRDNWMSNLGRNSLFYYIISRTLVPLFVLILVFLFSILR